MENLENENKFLKSVMRQYDKKFGDLKTAIEFQIEEDEETLQNEERQDLKIYIEVYNYLLDMVEEVEEEIRQFRIKKRNEILWNKGE